jgi:hypothetical protein
VADQAKPKNPNLRKFTPKAGPNSMGFKRRSKSSSTSNLSAGRDKPLFEAIRSDKFVQTVDATRDALTSKLANYPEVLTAVEFTLDTYLEACKTKQFGVTSPIRISLEALESQFSKKLTHGQLSMAKRAFKEELAVHL